MKIVPILSGQLAFVDQGQGPPLLLVHGFPLDHTLWRNQIEPLAAHYRVIAPDLRGIGQSSAVSAAPLTMATFADDLAELLDTLGVREPIHFCGLSMGGYIAWEFWRRHSQRLRSLILCDTKAAADTPETAATREQWAVDVLRSGTAVVEQAILPRLMAPATFQQHPAIGEQVRQMLLNTRAETFAAGQRGMALRFDMRPYLAEVRLPTLLIVGSEDAISPPHEMQAMAEAISGSRLITIPQVGHLTPLEAPSGFTTAVQTFLAEQG